MRSSIRLTVVAVVATLVPVAGISAAEAGDDEVIRQGASSGSADWKIKAKSDDGRIEVEAEIDSNRSGQRWKWSLKRNGEREARGHSTTRGRSGSFEVERKTADAPGGDSFRFRAKHPATGQVCVARVTF